MYHFLTKYNASVIVALTVPSIIGLIAFSGEPVPELLKNSPYEATLLSLGYPNAILFNICIGYLTSVFFWWLVVYVPDRTRRKIIRSHLEREYTYFKESIVQVLIWAAGLSETVEKVKELTEPTAFKEYFGRDGRAAWYAAINELQNGGLRLKEVEAHLKRFATAVEYTLNNVTINDPGTHNLLNNLNRVLLAEYPASDSYQKSKDMGSLLWSLMARYDMAEGYYEKDLIQDTIENI